MQIEDPIDPSCRLKGMSWDFTYLIEDPITDIQLIPTSFMLLSKPIIYLGSSWTAFRPHSDIDLKFFSPSIYNKFGIGIEYALDYYQHNEKSMEEIPDNKLRNFKQHFSFLTGIPFLKENGILVLKLSYLYHHDNSTDRFRYKSDTFYIVDGDTTRSHYSSYTFSSSEFKSPQWWISLDQLLPFTKTSSMDFILEFCSYNSSKIDDDTMINNECDSSIFYVYPPKVIATHHDSLTTSDHWLEKETMPTGIITVIYKINPDWGKLRFLGRLAISKGHIDSQHEEVQDNMHNHKTYIIYPDTNYFFGDSSLTHDTIYSTSQKNGITYNSVIGAGGVISSGKENILLGVKLGYYYNQESNDLICNSYQSYSAIVSLGAEWYPVPSVYLRDGLSIYYYDDIIKTLRGDILETEKFTSIDGYGAIGFGIKAGDHLKFDYATEITLDQPLKYWSLDCTFQF